MNLKFCNVVRAALMFLSAKIMSQVVRVLSSTFYATYLLLYSMLHGLVYEFWVQLHVQVTGLPKLKSWDVGTCP